MTINKNVMQALGPAFRSLDDVQVWVLDCLLRYGRLASPRGFKTLELVPLAFTLRHPTCRVVTLPSRRWSFPLAIGEFCWHAGGSREVEQIAWYAPAWRDFSHDGLTISGSSYGYHMLRSGAVSQWERASETLRVDPESRQAILYFGDSNQAPCDRACATSLQFLIRRGRLIAVVNMRSNDAVWGLPYDVFVFSMFQEWMARILGVELGEYHHVAASMHLYERHFALAERVTASRDDTSPACMPAMTDVSELAQFLDEERAVRAGATPTHRVISRYWAELLEVLDWNAAWRKCRDARPEQLPRINNDLYERLARTSARAPRD